MYLLLGLIDKLDQLIILEKLAIESVSSDVVKSFFLLLSK